MFCATCVINTYVYAIATATALYANSSDDIVPRLFSSDSQQNKINGLYQTHFNQLNNFNNIV